MNRDQPTPASTGAAAVGTGQIVQRPEPGLARGRWEAPAWTFWSIAVLAIAACLAWAAWAQRSRLSGLGGARSRWRPLRGRRGTR